MNQLQQLFARLTWAQRIALGLAAIAVVSGLFWLQHWNDERGFKPLFSGMAAEDAAAVTAKLRETAIDYRLSEDGSTISVPADRVAEVRLQLVSAGLPRSGRIGFELFDKTNFGSSEFAEQVNYHRAIEGELERSVMSLGEVEQARVHITLAKESLYTEARQPAKASILVKLRHIGGLTPQNVAALCQLVASAVPSLRVDQVSVLDTSGNLLNRPRPSGGDGAEQTDAAALEYRKSVEHEVQIKATQTLEPLLGAEHFRVGVSAEVDLSSGEQSEEIFDPQKTVMLASQTTQDGPALPAASGVPGTASNLPRPTATPESSGASSTNYARRTENVSYQSSRVVRHTQLPQGGVKKLSLSVLVDHTLRWDQGKRVIEPPTEEKLKVIRDLVAAATGLDMNRGDQLVVEAFPFESTLTAEPLTLDRPQAAPGNPSPLPPWLVNLLAQKNGKIILCASAGVVLLLAVGSFLLIRRAGKRRKAAEIAAALEAAHLKELTSPADDAEKQVEARMAAQAADQSRKEAEAMLALKIPTGATKKTAILTKHIVAEAKANPTAMAHVVRSWLNGEYKR